MMSSLVHTWHPLRAPAAASRRRRIHHTRRFIFISRCAVEERTVIDSYKNLNGNGRGMKYEEVEREGKNGKLDMYLESDNGNGGLMKYEEGNGVAGKLGNIQVEERERKKRIEEIGKEDAWFKTFGDQPQVSVAPGGRWNRFKTYSTIQRTLEIWGFFFAFIFRTWLNSQKFSYPGGMTQEKKANRRRVLAKWLKENILRLGPTFIKIGQQFSTQVDILPQEYVDQLSELQDQVPPFPSDTAVSIIGEELGAPIGNIFDRFDYEPIAAASLGQAHRASLNGQEVVIKVHRPGLKDLFDIDLKNLRVIAEYLQKVDPKSDGAKRDWVGIYDECASVLYQEIDYTKEAANAEKFAENFKSMDYVKVPTIVWDYTTPQCFSAGHLLLARPLTSGTHFRQRIEMRDRSKNRKPTQRGRYLSSEAIQAVQSLKRSKSALLLQGDPPGSETAGAREKVQRLIKKDMVASMRELLSQDEALLALFVFEEIRKEHWYRPKLLMYLDIISVLAKSNLQKELEQICSYLKREYHLEADTERFNLLIGVLMESGFVNFAMDCYLLMKLWKHEPDRETYIILIHGLQSKDKLDILHSIRLDAKKQFGASLDFLEKKEDMAQPSPT